MRYVKLTTLYLIVLFSGFFACTNLKEETKPEFTIIAARTDGEMSVDGLLNEAVWQWAQTVVLRENRTGAAVADSAVLTRVKTCYNENILFIGFICNDPDTWSTFTQRDEHLWKEEVVEVFLDIDRELNTYVEIEVSPANVLFDSYIVDPVNIDVEATSRFDLPNIKTAVSLNGTLNKRDDRDHQWAVEIALPFADLVEDVDSIIPGKTEWRINFYRVNADQDKESVGYAWSPTGARFHKPSVFGTLVFEK
jgi:hypothetical protein